MLSDYRTADTNCVIPKVLHYCNFGGGQDNSIHRACRASWQAFFPDYQWREWNESNSPLHVDYCQAALDNRYWSKLSNYVRLWALYAEGGLYLDTDVEVVRSFEPLRANACYVGFQSRNEIPGWVNNAVLGAEPGHPFLAQCMALTLQRYRLCGEFLLSPWITTRVLKAGGLSRYGSQNIEGVQVYPVEYFYPYSWQEDFTPACVTGDTVAVHHWNHSWAETST